MKRQVILAVLCAVLLAACSSLGAPAPQATATDALLASARQTMIAAGQIPEQSPTPASAAADNQTATPASSSGGPEQPAASVPGPGVCVPPGSPVELGLVLEAADSVTLLVSIDGQEQRVRYIGLAPPADPNFQPQASNKHYEMTVNKVVMLLRDVSDQDESGNLLRYVFLSNRDGVFLNYELVHQGFALAVPVQPDIACWQTLRQAEDQARVALQGLWAPTPIPSSTAYRPVATFTRPAVDVICDPSYPTVCIQPPPPYLHCGNVPHRHFPVLPPDPHNLDSDGDGIGCEN